MKNKKKNIDQWIEPRLAVDIANKKVIKSGLTDNLDIINALENGHPETPLLVERLDDPEVAYYLIPWMISEGVIFVVKVNALNGDFLELRTFSKPTPSPYLMPTQALACAQQEFPTSTFGNPQLVWQPCTESTSPMEPFYKIPYDEGVLYIRMNKTIFHKPTPLMFG